MQIYKVLIGALVLLVVVATASAASLDVRVTHVRPTKTICVSIYDDASHWASKKKPVAIRCVKAHNTVQTVRMDGLAPGRYAVRVHQDPNHSGIPEPPSFAVARAGTSSGHFRADPSNFDEALVPVGKGGSKISIHLFATGRY